MAVERLKSSLPNISVEWLVEISLAYCDYESVPMPVMTHSDCVYKTRLCPTVVTQRQGQKSSCFLFWSTFICMVRVTPALVFSVVLCGRCLSFVSFCWTWFSVFRFNDFCLSLWYQSLFSMEIVLQYWII